MGKSSHATPSQISIYMTTFVYQKKKQLTVYFAMRTNFSVVWNSLEFVQFQAKGHSFASVLSFFFRICNKIQQCLYHLAFKNRWQPLSSVGHKSVAKLWVNLTAKNFESTRLLQISCQLWQRSNSFKLQFWETLWTTRLEGLSFALSLIFTCQEIWVEFS